MSDGPFDHLEIHGDEGFLPDALKVDLREASFSRIEIGPPAGEPPRSYTIRLDGRRVLSSAQEDLPVYYESLFDYLGKHGVTLRLREFLRELGREVVLVETFSAAEPAAAPKGFDVEHWNPETDAAPTETQLDSIPMSGLQKFARVAAVVLSIALWFIWQHYYYQLPFKTRHLLESGERERQASEHEKALRQATQNY